MTNPQLIELYDEIEMRAHSAVTERPVWPCRRGCDACCRRLAHPPEVTAVEWQLMSQGLQALPTTTQAVIGHKITALTARESDATDFIICPFLDEVVGACLIYAQRPAACRMYGFYVSRQSNMWCQQIEDLYQAGALEGVTLGNYSAMQRQLERAFGDIQSIVIWYQVDSSPK
jgi:Fe-S-cluster containining protein